MTDIGSTYAEYMADDDGNIDEDELSETFQEILDYAVESYEDDGCTTEDYTTDSGVSGKLIKATDSDVVDTVAQDFPLTDVEIDNPVYYIFATSDLKIVYIYADQETADALITTYSLEGTPTTELTDEMIEQMEEDTYNEYIAPYYETDDEDSDDTITDDEDSSIIIEDGDDDSTTDESSDNETQESDDTIVITDDETTSSVVE
jgi:hypothetical protein